jgi:peptidyl-prolyl cis-trans isomerase B (cyclophilin B)
VAGSAKRERQLARERYERQQQRRAAAVARRRRTQQIVAVMVAVLIVVGGITALASKLGGNDNTTAASKPTKPVSVSPSASPSASASASPSTSPSVAAGGCTYTKSAEKASKDVGLPTYDKAKAATYKKPFSATLKTNLGDIVIAMAADKAPCTTNSFRHLATTKFFDSSPCHRLTTQGIFVLQCGDPTGLGSGGPGYGFGVENAPADGKYPAGTVAMARTSDPNSNGSQFFLVYKETSLPDATGYTVFGTITKGLDIVTQVAKAGTAGANGDGAPKKKVTIESVTIGKS